MQQLLLLVGALRYAHAIVDYDVRQGTGAGTRWRCLQQHLEPALTEALATNWSGLGWSAELVQPLIANLSECEELHLDGLRGTPSVQSLTTAILALDDTASSLPGLGVSPGCLLRVIDLEGSALEDDGVVALARVMRACPALEHFHAPRNAIADDGALALASALLEPAPHRSLGVLDLSTNEISDHGATGLARLLRRPPRELGTQLPLRNLRLDANRISSAGFVVLGDALRDAPASLTTLSLSGNPGGDAGAIALARGLVLGRTRLRRLHLAATNMSDVGAAALADALRHPEAAPPLEGIALHGNPAVSVRAHAELEELLARNRVAGGGEVADQASEAGGVADGASDSSHTGVFRVSVPAVQHAAGQARA